MRNMSRINLLSQHTSNQIAAGEVVERPMSVVKELLENAIDAGSTAITIETRGGGCDYIRVSDNGSGIHADDVKCAFLRHATSKMAVAEDLEHICTLGFRGEALASIAAVARVRLKSKTPDSDFGKTIVYEGGELREERETGCPDGTSIEVSNLFFNIPARLKFLKSPQAESALTSDYVSRMILAEPGIAIKLIQNDKQIYKSAGDGSRYNALYCVYGSDILDYLYELSYDDGYVKLTGYVGSEQLARVNRNQQSFFVNSRYIKSQKLSFALQRAFGTRLMNGRFPFVVMDITIASEDIDVNVHPNKLDIRFKDENRVMHAVVSTIKTALGDYAPRHIEHIELNHIGTVTDGIDSDVLKDESTVSHSAEYIPDEQKQLIDQSMFYPKDHKEVIKLGESAHAFDIGGLLDARQKDVVMPTTYVQARQQQIMNNIAYAKPEQIGFEALPYMLVGQLFDCYWIVQQGENVFFIDQHAAHERKLYDNIMEKGLNTDSQQLLTPLIVKLTPIEFDTLMSNIKVFNELGFDIDEFGSLTISIRAIPHVLGQPQTVQFLHDAIDTLLHNGKVSAADVKRRTIIQTACKHAVKAGAMLSNDEIAELLDMYAKSGIPMTCPHGRPVMICMNKSELEKLFKRIV